MCVTTDLYLKRFAFVAVGIGALLVGLGVFNNFGRNTPNSDKAASSIFGEAELTPSPTPLCSKEKLSNVVALLNIEDEPFTRARAVISLKDSNCFTDNPSLIDDAQKLLDKEEEVVKTTYNTDFASYDLIKEFEKDPLLLKTPSVYTETQKTQISELTNLVSKFTERVNAWILIQSDQLWEIVP